MIFVLEYNLFLYPGGEKKSATLKTGLMGIGEVNIMRPQQVAARTADHH